MTYLCIKPRCGDDCSQCNHAVALTRAAVDVLQERQRQVTAEGYHQDHDDEHDMCELARAAASYLCRTDALMLAGTRVWPKGWEFKPADYRRALVKACALALAELERVDRQGAPVLPLIHTYLGNPSEGGAA